MPLMMTRQNPKAMLERAAALTGSTGFAADAHAMGFRYDPDAPPVAYAVFEQFRGWECEMHLGFEPGHRLTREIIEFLVLCCFHKNGMGLDRLWIQIGEANVHAMATSLKMGFQFEYRKRGGFHGSSDAIVMSLQPAPAEAAKQTQEAG